MHAEAEVALLGDRGLARVHAHADAQRRTCRPLVSVQRALGCGCGCNGVLGPLEGDEEGVALGVDLLASVLFEGRSQEPVMVGTRFAVTLAQLLEQASRSLDVGEEEGDGA
jgi:hypothetical protein